VVLAAARIPRRPRRAQLAGTGNMIAALEELSGCTSRCPSQQFLAFGIAGGGVPHAPVHEPSPLDERIAALRALGSPLSTH